MLALLKALALSASLVVAPADTTPPADVIIRAADVSQSSLKGAWTLESDRSCPGGLKLIVLSPKTYLNGPPGAVDADRTTIARERAGEDPWPKW